MKGRERKKRQKKDKKMTFKSYIKPETEHVVLNIHQAVLDPMYPETSTDEQWGNQGQFEEEDDEYDEFHDDF